MNVVGTHNVSSLRKNDFIYITNILKTVTLIQSSMIIFARGITPSNLRL